LFPASKGDLKTECSCPDWSNPCKHIAAVYYLLGEQFDADPFLLFRLRGKSKDEIMAMLRARRTAAEPTPEPVEETKRKPCAPAEPVVSLEKCLDRFWDTAENLDDFAVKIEAPTVDAIPVKRLGAPGRFVARQQGGFHRALCARVRWHHRCGDPHRGWK
jgi:uncharacterized Zn finger protein